MLLKIKVSPRSSKSEIKKISDDTLKIRLTSPPVDGQANEELIELLSESYHVPKSRIIIKKGLRGKNKIVEIL